MTICLTRCARQDVTFGHSDRAGHESTFGRWLIELRSLIVNRIRARRYASTYSSTKKDHPDLTQQHRCAIHRAGDTRRSRVGNRDVPHRTAPQRRSLSSKMTSARTTTPSHTPRYFHRTVRRSRTKKINTPSTTHRHRDGNQNAPHSHRHVTTQHGHHSTPLPKHVPIQHASQRNIKNNAPNRDEHTTQHREGEARAALYIRNHPRCRARPH